MLRRRIGKVQIPSRARSSRNNARRFTLWSSHEVSDAYPVRLFTRDPVDPVR